MGGSGGGDGLVVGGAEGEVFREVEGSDGLDDLVAFRADVRLVEIVCGGALFFGVFGKLLDRMTMWMWSLFAYLPLGIALRFFGIGLCFIVDMLAIACVYRLLRFSFACHFVGCGVVVSGQAVWSFGMRR